jgi:hypothetical protein
MVVDAGSLYTSINNSLRLITPANVTDPIEFWLAFLLVLAILNTVLKKIKFFEGDENKNSRAITALIISFFAVTAAWVSPVLMYMSSTLAVTAMILVAILIVASLAGYDKQLSEGKAAQWLFVAAIIVLFAGGLLSYAVVPASSGSGVGGGSGGPASTGSEIGSVISSALGSAWNSGILLLMIFLIIVVAYVFKGSGGSKSS